MECGYDTYAITSLCCLNTLSFICFLGDGEIILDGKVFLVTGASAGIGKETTRELARLGATVIMACRDMEKANQAVKDIRSTVDSGKLIPMELDLSKLDSVRSFAQRVLRDFPRIDVLINNAGVSVPYRSTTDDGFEMNFGVNHMGHYLLTRLLLDRVVQSAPSRVVIVASTLHERGRIDFDDLSGEKWTWPADGGKVRLSPGYCNSKLANVYFARELADRLRTTQGEGSAQDVTVVSLCPGFCYTELFRYSDIKWYQYVMFAPVALLFMRSASQVGDILNDINNLLTVYKMSE
ncbi:hypothetical protein AAG570_001099 [Ranatra chinensis]|uniref:Uncharacterized protein n=1 Tax=Ranatra chinensis TaxID=642074 RepID=A0ABD0YAW8_9HEMI